MSDVAIPQKLGVFATIKEGIEIGVRNIGPILVNVLLWGLTIWIPYLNVGTTIGLMVGIVSKASRGEVIPMTEIFDPKYRKYMGEYFLTAGFVGMGVFVGMIFFVIPGIVICLAWSLAILLVIDKGKNPTEAITLSNNLTYGFKKKIFGVYFVVGGVFSVVLLILSGISGGFYEYSRMNFFLGCITILVVVFSIFVIIGIQASIYKQLAGNTET